MGGLGSGRYPTKPLVGDYLALDVRALYRKGWLQPGRQGRWRWRREGRERGGMEWLVGGEEGDLALELELRYAVRSAGREAETLHYKVPLDWSRCHFGGWRPWFLCPNIQCGRRVAILYGGRHFLCRRCQGLVYASQRIDLSARCWTELSFHPAH